MKSERLGYEFRDPSLLEQALTHRSAGNTHNERLEFLGDSVLNFVIADAVFRRFSGADEGDLSRVRARLVRKETLAAVARDQHLGDVINLGSGELRSGGHRRSSILADAVEAILGAVYLDGGFRHAADLVHRWFDRHIDSLPPIGELKDAKTRLQEFVQARKLPLPEYILESSEGADHARTFHVLCRVDGLENRSRGSGTSRRKAEQEAAKSLLQELEK